MYLQKRYLHEDEEVFRKIMNDISSSTKLDNAIIVKDYYLFMLLKLITEKQTKDGLQEMVLKGSTSLSKAYHVTQSFSEDLELCLPPDKIKSKKARERLTDAVTNSMEELDLTTFLLNETEKSRDYNTINGIYTTFEVSKTIEPFISVEITNIIKEYPFELKEVSSYITDFLIENGTEKSIRRYGLEPFYVNTVSVYRTFVDILFCLADYYLKKKPSKHSKHLYDLYRLINYMSWNNTLFVINMKQVFNEARRERKDAEKCLNTQADADLIHTLNEALFSDFYKKDYECRTQYTLFERVDYNTCKQTILDFINSGKLMPCYDKNIVKI